MKFFVLLLVFVAVETMVDARPSTTQTSEETKKTVAMCPVKRIKKHIDYSGASYSGWETASANVAHSSTSVHSHSKVHRHHILPHLLHHSVSFSETHGFNANLNLPHSSLSVGHSETHEHRHQHTLG